MSPEPHAPADRGWPLALTKHHGLGNDFLVAVDPSRPLDGADATRWCDRREGIGADGLIQAVPIVSPADGERRPLRYRMTLWNSDGGRAEISGNGLRCLAQALAERLGHDGGDDLTLTIETDAGTREAIVLARPVDAAPGEDQVRVGMGKAVDGPGPSDRWAGLGVEVVDQVGVDVGNPHLVGFVDSTTPVGGFDMAAIGPPIEGDHPGGLNVHVVRVVDRGRIEMVIWERGAGVTRACGSGACAAAFAADRAGLVDGRSGVDVVMPGGAARVEVFDDEVVLTGPAVRVAEVRVDG